MRTSSSTPIMNKKNFKELFDAEDPTLYTKIKPFCRTKFGKCVGWFDLIINGLLPFSAWESKGFCAHVEHESLALSTFVMYLSRLTALVKARFSEPVPDKFTVVFNGWTEKDRSNTWLKLRHICVAQKKVSRCASLHSFRWLMTHIRMLMTTIVVHGIHFRAVQEIMKPSCLLNL